MAHPDHDQVIGRIAGARLRGMADGRAVTRVGPEVHPDAETWAAYVEGGLQADEVVRLETHLGGCAICRRLVAVLTTELRLSPEERRAVYEQAIQLGRFDINRLKTIGTGPPPTAPSIAPAARKVSPLARSTERDGTS